MNVAGWLRYAYHLTDSQAQAKGMNMSELKKTSHQSKTERRQFTGVGGKKEKPKGNFSGKGNIKIEPLSGFKEMMEVKNIADRMNIIHHQVNSDDIEGL